MKKVSILVAALVAGSAHAQEWNPDFSPFPRIEKLLIATDKFVVVEYTNFGIASDPGIASKQICVKMPAGLRVCSEEKLVRLAPPLDYSSPQVPYGAYDYTRPAKAPDYGI